MANKVEYVELGLTCANACEALNLGMNRNQAEQLGQSVLVAVERLTRWVEPAMHTPDDFLIVLNQDYGRDPEAHHRAG